MKRFIPILIAIASAAAIASPVLAQDQQAAPAGNSASQTEVQSELAMRAGDWNSAAALSGQSYRENPTLRNEFNLATAYVHTGQPALAIPLYADVARSGHFTETQALYDYHSRARPGRVQFNYADEANRRLDMLTGSPDTDELK